MVFEGFEEFDNDFVTNEVSSLKALIDDQIASKEGKSDEKNKIVSLTISTPRVCNVLEGLKTIRSFFSCTPEVDDTTFVQINTLENSVFNQSLRCPTKRGQLFKA